MWVLRSHKDCHDINFEVVQLWAYEVFRTFRERMIDNESEDEVIDIIRKETKKAFNMVLILSVKMRKILNLMMKNKF